MEELSRLEAELAESGIKYTKLHEITYRVGFVIQTFALALLLTAELIVPSLLTAAVLLFDIGVVISAFFLLVWKRYIKTIIVSLTLTGILVQLISLAGQQMPDTILITGIGSLCAGAAGLAGKEAYCFRFIEGWIIMGLLPAIILLKLTGATFFGLEAIPYALLLLLYGSLTAKKLSQRLLKSCEGGVCGLPGDDGG